MLQFLASQLFRQAFLLLLGLIRQPFRLFLQLFLLLLGRHGGGRRHDCRLCRLRIGPPPGG
jgi:hypothetical protein